MPTPSPAHETPSGAAPADAKPSGSVPLFELVGGLSAAMDLISPQVVDHHARVASIAVRLGRVLGLPARDLADLAFAGLTHDIGAFSLRGRLDALEFETDQVLHAEVSWRLLAKFPGFGRIARVVRHHHLRRDHASAVDEAPDVLDLADVLHVADRAEVRLRRMDVHPSPEDIMAHMTPRAGTWFAPAHVQALGELAATPEFWREMAATDQRAFLKQAAAPRDELLDLDKTQHFSRLFSQVIDFRSRFTSTHSRGVADTAGEMLRLAGGDEGDRRRMRVAGDLHDLGKLAVPASILEKPAALTDDEFAVMRGHARHTLSILSAVPGLERIAAWAGNHHERLGGTGYPRGLGDATLDTGSRIMAVADVFTALTEDRPYRDGMDRSRTVEVLASQAGTGVLDRDAVDLLLTHYDELNEVRTRAQERATRDFRIFSAGA